MQLDELKDLAVHNVLGDGGPFSGVVLTDDTKTVFVVNPRHG
jgi:hypothetical protein